MHTNVRQKGAEILEFTLALLPMLVIVLVLLDTAWAIFAKSSLQYAVRLATRRGVTITSQQLSSGQCLTDVVKSTVQQNSFGMLTGDSKLPLIRVNYFKPPQADTTDPVTDVSAQLDGNTPGNIMQVSVQGFSLLPLVPRLFTWKDKPERNPLLITVYAADRDRTIKESAMYWNRALVWRRHSCLPRRDSSRRVGVETSLDPAGKSACATSLVRGVSTLEFAFVLFTLIPLLLGTGVVGINMIRTLQTIQLARDAGHMFARGVDFSQPGNQTILGNIGGSLGLSTTAGSGSAVVILSAITYVDKNLCTDAGAIDGSGNPYNCTNFNKWVFTQRLLIGNSGIRQSNIGTPANVPINSATGKIVLADYVLKTGAVAQFNGINPYSVVNGLGQGLPSRQTLFVAEAGATGFSLRPFVPNAVSYSYGLF